LKSDRWYKVRIRVTKDRIEGWIDEERVVDVDTKGKKIDIRAECELCRPFGIATYRTSALIREIRVRSLSADDQKLRQESIRNLQKTLLPKMPAVYRIANQHRDNSSTFYLEEVSRTR
jgi:hypothetical protein